MSHLCLCLLVGLPGAGKSTFCKTITIPYKKIVFSFDEKCVEKQYKQFRKHMLNAIETIINDCLQANTVKTVIIIDDVMYYRSMRYSIFNLARKFEIGFCQVYFNTDVDTCVHRNVIRGTPEITEDMIRRMHKAMDVPKVGKSLMDLNLLEHSSSPFTVEGFIQLLELSFKNPLNKIVIPSKNVIEQSKVHKVDLALRKMVHKMVSEESDSNKKSALAKELNEKRKNLLGDLRSNVFSLPDRIDDFELYL